MREGITQTAGGDVGALGGPSSSAKGAKKTYLRSRIRGNTPRHKNGNKLSSKHNVPEQSRVWVKWKEVRESTGFSLIILYFFPVLSFYRFPTTSLKCSFPIRLEKTKHITL